MSKRANQSMWCTWRSCSYKAQQSSVDVKYVLKFDVNTLNAS